MREILYLTNQATRIAEEQAVDACLAIADESGLQARIERLAGDEPNSVKLIVLMYPPLLDTFDRVAWRRTYLWGARHWCLPAGLIGVRFQYQATEYEFVGATIKTVTSKAFFVAIRQSDGWIMQMAESFVRQTILPAMPAELKPIGLFSIGLGEKERIFV